MRRACVAALLLLAATPGARAIDLLPGELDLGETQARVIVRSTTGRVVVSAEPAVEVALAGGPTFELTPRELLSPASWRGLEGVVEVHLRRPVGSGPVEILLEGDERAGVLVDWPPPQRATPLGPPAWILAGIALLARRRGPGK